MTQAEMDILCTYFSAKYKQIKLPL